MTGTTTLIRLPTQPDGTPWPTREWPKASLNGAISDERKSRFFQLIEQVSLPEGSERIGQTNAFLIIQNGRMIYEYYGEGTGPDTTQNSWSMAKSITQALIGIAVRQGVINAHESIPVTEWSGRTDPRSALTWDQLLRMSSGLQWIEDYIPGNPSDVIEMLYGHHALEDTGAYAADKPLVHPAGTQWLYSSGTTNILCRALCHVPGRKGDAFRDFMFDELFTPIGMTSPRPTFDRAGTFVGSSFCFCTPRDFARFGYLYLRDGIWDGQRILPEGWVDYARSPTPVPETETYGYGAHWWLGLCGPNSFSANGYQGQYTIVLPDLDMVMVRNGVSEGDEQKEGVQLWLSDVADCFRS